jgi:hypothetical protein
MSCKNKIIEEIAEILAQAIIRKNIEKGLAIQGKRSDNCKKYKRLNKSHVR